MPLYFKNRIFKKILLFDFFYSKFIISRFIKEHGWEAEEVAKLKPSTEHQASFDPSATIHSTFLRPNSLRFLDFTKEFSLSTKHNTKYIQQFST